MKKLIIICPSIRLHPEASDEQPGCLLEKCPECGGRMWISAKKREIRDAFSDEVTIFCYDCALMKADNKDPELKDMFNNGRMLKI